MCREVPLDPEAEAHGSSVDVQMARGSSSGSSLRVDLRQVCRAAQMALAMSQSVRKASPLLKWIPGAKTDFLHRLRGPRAVLAAYVHYA